MNQIQTESLQEMPLNLGSSDFDAFVLEAIDQTLTKLGISVKQVFYSFLENHYRLDKEDIPSRIVEFDNALGKTFGTSASLIEIDIMKNLREKVPLFNYLLESSDLSLAAYLTSMKQHLENF